MIRKGLSVNKTIKLCIISSLLLPTYVQAFAEADVPEACRKIQELNQTQIDAMGYGEFSAMKSACLAADFKQQMDNSWEDLVGDTTEEDEQKSCIDQFNSIDFDVLTFDPTSLLETAYTAIMDQIDGFACEAHRVVKSEINQLSLDGELPYGLGGLSITPGYTEEGDVIKVDQVLTNEDIQDNINNSIWGDDLPPAPSNRTFNYKRVSDLLGDEKTLADPKSAETVERTRLKLKDFGFSSSSQKEDN